MREAQELQRFIRRELALAFPEPARLVPMTPEERLERLEEKEQEWRETVRAAGGVLLFLFVLAMLARR